MNPKRSLWSDLPLSTGIATLVCYAGVFGDVIGIEEVASRLGVSGQDEFYTSLNELHLQGKLILKDGFAGLPDLEEKIAIKVSKIATAKHLIDSRLNCLNKLGRNPIIKFVGISGSLAAHNPVRDRNNRLDIDIFLITRKQCLWVYNILKGVRNLFPRSRDEPELCINYVIDESNLMIANRNLYTATEIRNLIPVSGLDAYRKFLQANSWVDYYYPQNSGVSAPVTTPPSRNLLNKLFYFVYIMLKSIKCLDLDPIRKISLKTDPRGGLRFNVLSVPCGGYQVLVQNKFNRLAGIWFPELLNADLIGRLFPDELSAEIARGEAVNLSLDYSKYG